MKSRKTKAEQTGASRNGEVVAQREEIARAAGRYLSKADPRMRRIIERIGPHRPIITPNAFVALAGSIIHQQISMTAAAAIEKRVKKLCPRGRLSPPTIRALDENTLRGAGLSRQKARYLHDLAEHFADRRLTAAKLRRLSDEEVVEAASRVKGIGRWTAEMLLIFCLERPDVWPIDDLGLRKAVRDFLELPDLPDSVTIRNLAEPWRPYRSYATWYLWRSLEGPLMPGIAL